MWKLVVSISIILCPVILCCCDDTRPLSAPPRTMPTALTAPVKIAVFNDKTRSADHTRTEQLQLADFDPPIKLLRVSGGEIAFGLIRDVSNRRLLRLRIETPPPAPPALNEVGNPFEVAQRRDAYLGQLEQYQADRQRWCRASEQRIAEFKKELEPLLAQRADAGRSDIWGALSRANLFLEERDTGWPSSVQLYVIVIGDGDDNVGAPVVTLSGGVKLLLINGAGRVGALARLNPSLYESTKAAWQALEMAHSKTQRTDSTISSPDHSISDLMNTAKGGN